MKTARVLYQGQTLSAVESDGQLLLANGQRVGFDAVTWLPPLAPTPRPRTILALGLNYADHAKELAFKAPEEPLVFIKGEGSLIGHRAQTRRPAGVAYMHYECELVLRICKNGKYIQERHASNYYNGITVGIDFTARDIQDICKAKGLPWEKAKAFDNLAGFFEACANV